MQVSYNLLKEYVDIELSPDDLADRLSMNGIVAEHKKAVFDGIEGVVVGEIKEIKLHNQNDNLSICRVDIKNRELEVVCGAKNMRVGDYVPFATESAILPGLGKVTEKEIQGVLSKGMICSASELGLEKSKSTGVLILDNKYPLGEEIANLRGIGNDVIFDFEIFSNRPDLMSIIGIAREIAAFSGKELHIPEINILEIDVNISEKISIQVEDKDLCPRYAGRIVQGVKIKESPFWLRWKLFLLGVRPINNIVDVTNYVMMETGQPLHAFDLDYIHGKKIIVRRAKAGEKFNTLDGVERELTEENLVIADKEKAIALAGVMGGENSEIKDYTKDIFLESAYFNPVNNRRTSRYLSLRTDASNRFEKGIDPCGQIYALNRAAFLTNQITSGNILTGVIDQSSENISNTQEIKLNFDKVKKIMGIKIAQSDQESRNEISELLKRLEFNITYQDNSSIKAIPPTFRGDIQRDVDIIEEIAKIYGYDKIPSTLFKSTVVQKGISERQKIVDKISNILVGCGLHQTINYSMITPIYFDWMNLPNSHPLRETVRLLNPLIQDQTVMRTTLIPGILKSIQWNINHKVEEIKIFEIGKVFMQQKNRQNSKLPLEKLKVAGGISKIGRGDIWGKAEKWDIFYLKGILETVFDNIGLQNKNISYIHGNFPAFDTERNGLIEVNNQEVGIFGKISQNISNIMDIPEDIFLFELDLSLLYSHTDQKITFKPLPRYPTINRDIAIIVAEQISVDQINKTILEVNSQIIKKVELFDIFRGKQIEKGYKSVAFSIIFQAEDRTLTDEEVDKMIESVKIQLRNRFQAELRQ
jgi:phenylalanyl-tRNA synthetase beta chain